MFKISRGICDICCPFLESVTRPATATSSCCLGRAVSLQLLFMVKPFLKMAQFSTIGMVTPSCCPSGCQEPLADSQLSIFSRWHPEHSRSHICSVVYGKVTETPASVLDSGKSDPGQYSGGLYPFAQTATIKYHRLVGLNHRNFSQL